jgi:hypothetical protein
MAITPKRRPRPKRLITATIPEFREWCVGAFDDLQVRIDGLREELSRLKDRVDEMQETAPRSRRKNG